MFKIGYWILITYSDSCNWNNYIFIQAIILIINWAIGKVTLVFVKNISKPNRLYYRRPLRYKNLRIFFWGFENARSVPGQRTCNIRRRFCRKAGSAQFASEASVIKYVVSRWLRAACASKQISWFAGWLVGWLVRWLAQHVRREDTGRSTSGARQQRRRNWGWGSKERKWMGVNGAGERERLPSR